MINTSKCDFSTYKVRKLREDEVIKSFDCGDDDLNYFILDNAECYHKARLAETYVYEHIDNGNVIAYFSLANDRISIDDFSDNTEFNRFRRHRFKNEKRIKSYPAVKICRLGIDNYYHGRGVGSMLIDFIKLYYTKDNKAGCRFLTVDAYQNAVTFYRRNNFQPLHNDNDRTSLLYYDLNEIVV